jgi:hypothetical protein
MASGCWTILGRSSSRGVNAFSADWLALREPYDRTARNPAVLAAVADAVADLPSLRIVDLACGTGATMRATAPHLSPRQSWRLVDNNLSLLARVVQQDNVTVVPVDVARDLELALDGPVDLVTTSALLDLVSGEWLERFAVEAAVRKLPVYAALSYNGQIAFDPMDEMDEAVIATVNRHQRTDKGFGPALGPAGAATAISRFRELSYDVIDGDSDWTPGPSDRKLQRELLAGWALAAREIGSIPGADIADWLTRRSDQVTAGRSSIRVGHSDFFARHTGTR